MTASDLLAILPYLLVGEIFVKIITRVKHNRVRSKIYQDIGHGLLSIITWSTLAAK